MRKLIKKLKNIKYLTNKTQNKIGIDLGTSNTVVSFNGEIIYNEPTLIVLNKNTNHISSMGKEASAMIGRIPNHLEIIEPILDGVISNFEITEELIQYLLSLVNDKSYKIFGPTVVVGIPSIVSEVQIQTLHDATLNAGARNVYIVPEPYAAAVGMGLNESVKGPFLIIDIGGGTTDIMIFAFDGVVASSSLKIAGRAMNLSIAEYFKKTHKLDVGVRSIEKLKVAILGNKHNGVKNFYIHGRNIISGLPQRISVTKGSIRQVVYPRVSEILKVAKRMICDVTPDIAADLSKGKNYLVGGGASVEGLADFFSREMAIPILVDKNSLTVVASGAEKIAINPEKHLYGLFQKSKNNNLKLY